MIHQNSVVKLNKVIDSVLKEYEPAFHEENINIPNEEKLLVNMLGRSVPFLELVFIMLDKLSTIYIEKEKWGLFRNIHLRIGQIYEAQDKLELYLSKCLQICYLDIGGPNDKLYLEYPDIKPPIKSFAPGIISDVTKLVELFKINEFELKSIFFENTKVLEKKLPMTISRQDAWLKLNKTIFIS